MAETEKPREPRLPSGSDIPDGGPKRRAQRHDWKPEDIEILEEGEDPKPKK